MAGRPPVDQWRGRRPGALRHTLRAPLPPTLVRPAERRLVSARVANGRGFRQRTCAPRPLRASTAATLVSAPPEEDTAATSGARVVRWPVTGRIGVGIGPPSE